MLLAALVLLGCARGGDAADEVTARVQAARDRACSCGDLACAEDIAAKLATWQATHQARLDRMSARRPAVRARLTALTDEIAVCTERLRAAADPAPRPPADDPAAAPPPETQPPLQPGDIEPPPATPTPAMRSARSGQPTQI